MGSRKKRRVAIGVCAVLGVFQVADRVGGLATLPADVSAFVSSPWLAAFGIGGALFFLAYDVGLLTRWGLTPQATLFPQEDRQDAQDRPVPSVENQEVDVIETEKETASKKALRALSENMCGLSGVIDTTIHRAYHIRMLHSGRSIPRIPPQEIKKIPELLNIRIETLLHELESIGLEVPKIGTTQDPILALRSYEFYFGEIGLLVGKGDDLREAKKKANAICRAVSKDPMPPAPDRG